jgi:O-antigen/teichoic acid export membrane protein
MLGVSIFAEPIIGIMAAPDFGSAASVVPIVCLGYVFFGLNEHFRVPVMLTKRTGVLPPVFLVAVIVNVAANLVLIPIAGFVGAAWATVAGFVVFAFLGLWRYRQIDRYPYPLGRFWLVLSGMVVSFVVWRLAAKAGLSEVAHLGLGVVIWLLWAVALLARPLWQIRSAGLGYVSRTNDSRTAEPQ